MTGNAFKVESALRVLRHEELPERTAPASASYYHTAPCPGMPGRGQNQGCDRVTVGGCRGIIRLMPTPPRKPPAEEIFAVHHRLIEAARAEGFDEFLDWGSVLEGGEQYPLEAGEPGTRIGALLRSIRKTRAARTRVRRAEEVDKSKGRGEKPHQVIDDSLRDDARRAMLAARAALESAEAAYKALADNPNKNESLLEDARVDVRAARTELERSAAAFEQHADNVEKEAYPLKIADPPERIAANVMRGMLIGLDELAKHTGLFETSEDIATVREWEALLSDIAVELKEMGWKDSQIALILFDSDDPDTVEAVKKRRLRRRRRSGD
jgi:hypothetical protein